MRVSVFMTVMLVAGASMLGTGFASLPDSGKPVIRILKTRESVTRDPSILALPDSLDKNVEFSDADEGTEDELLEEEEAPPEINNPNTLRLLRGEKIEALLARAHLKPEEASRIAEKFYSVYSHSKLKAGQKFIIRYDEKRFPGEIIFKNLLFSPSPEYEVEITAKGPGQYAAAAGKVELTKIMLKAEGRIYGSFYGSAAKAGVTPEVVSELINAYSYDVDFQRDIKMGDRFTVVFEGYINKRGNYIKTSKPLYAKLKLRRREIEVYRFVREDGTFGYFYADGTNVKKALLKTPMNAARMTSGFGMRRHPILGYSKMHKGVDFGAPAGTPIYAAGDGEIVEMGWHGGYGNYIRIKHNSKYSTAYAHISRFAKTSGAGKTVKQGQIVAYVGSTGNSTGPHLHFEVLENSVQINPVSAKVPLGEKLSGKNLALFGQHLKKVRLALTSAPSKEQLARREEKRSENDRKL